MTQEAQKVISTNRKAFSDYDILEKYEAGIVLTGAEVKSIRDGHVNLKDAYARINGQEAFLYNCHVSPYDFAHNAEQEPTRVRKLLLRRGEINRLMGKVQEKGLTIVPLRVYLKGKHVKVELALAKGRRIWGKREEKRRKSVEKEIRAALKYRKR